MAGSTSETTAKSQHRFNVNDHSEFPSLGGGPQPQYQNPGQAVWANANQRATQQIPVQRPQHQSVTTPSASTQQQQPSQAQDQSQQALEDAFSFSQFSNSLDEYRQASQGINQHSSSNQPQGTSIDEFPPLNRNEHVEAGQDRRGSLIPNSVSGGYGGPSNFAQPSNHLSNRPTESYAPNSAINRILSPHSNGAGGTVNMSDPRNIWLIEMEGSLASRVGFNNISEQDKV